MVVRAICTAAASVAALLCSVSIAVAQDPIVIPVIPTAPPGANPAYKFQPLAPPQIEDRQMYYPEQGDGLNFPKQYGALIPNGYVTLLGNWTQWAPVWDDIGSGKPDIQGSIGSRWRFPNPGKYSWHCECPLGVRGEGDVYVVGPRPRVLPVLTSPDNKPPVSYLLDASASSVTDWEPWAITRYDFDLNGDGIYQSVPPDQSGPEPTAPIAYDAPGEYTVGMRVWDNWKNPSTNVVEPRSHEIPVNIIVPKRVAEPTPVKPVDDLALKAFDDTGAFKRTFNTANIKLTTRSKISLATLRKKGLSVRVSGLRSGDAVTSTMTKGKLVKGRKPRKVGAARTARASSTSVTIRVRLSKAARAILRSKPRAKTVRLAVLIEGSDGFEQTKAKNIRLG